MHRKTTVILSVGLVALCILFTGFYTVGTSQNTASKATYVGGSKCLLKCHMRAVASFKSNPHTKAFTAIVNSKSFLTQKEKGEEKACLKCHVTGYGQPGGFVDEDTTPDHAMVGCEACHGPGSEHIAVDAKNVTKKKETIVLKPDCSVCHLVHKHF